MTAWTCPECASQNADTEAECTVCGSERPAAGPAAARPAADDGRRPAEQHDRPAEASPAVDTYGTDDLYGTDLDNGDQTEVLPDASAAGYDERSKPTNRWTRWAPLAALALGVLVIAGFKVVPGLIHATPGPHADQTATPTPVPTSTFTEEPTPSPTQLTSVGLVTIDPAVADDPRTQPVAAMLDRYFSAINNRDYDTALSVYDPAGVVNPNDPTQANTVTRQLSTTNDSRIRLYGIATDTSGRGAVQAEVTFQSRQDPGYGPKSNPDETCTVWTLTYTLTQRSDGSYLILSSTGSHSACS